MVICGDYNICHEAIDIHDPIRNKMFGFCLLSGCGLAILNNGFVDSFDF
jgi:exodeoxyribonuclease-3